MAGCCGAFRLNCGTGGAFTLAGPVVIGLEATGNLGCTNGEDVT